MKEITYHGTEGIFYTKEEFQTLQAKILAQNNLIQSLMEQVIE